MTVNKVLAFLGIWGTGQIVCLTFDNRVWGGSGDMLANIINVICGFNIHNPLNAITWLGGFFHAIWTMLTWDYSMFDGNLFVIRIFLFFLTAAIVYGFVKS